MKSSVIKNFIEEDPGTLKVLLFTNAKKGTPFLYKALSFILQLSQFRKYILHEQCSSKFKKIK